MKHCKGKIMAFLLDSKPTIEPFLIMRRLRPEHKDVLTQFGYACKTLGTNIVTTSVSQAKGMVERANQTV
jgi:hypothetical protein